MAGIANQAPGARSGTAASDLYNAQQRGTANTIAQILAQGDALKGSVGGGGGGGGYVGGSPGYYWDNSGAVNAQYNVIRDDVSNLFGQAMGLVRGQAPAIQNDAAARVADINGLIAGQGAAASQRAQSQVGDQQSAAAAMGIDAAPQTARAAGIAQALGNYRTTFGDANTKYFNTRKDVALARNEATAGGFQFANDQEQNAIQAARVKALSTAKKWVPGSRGHKVGGGSSKAADKKLVTAINKQQKLLVTARDQELAQRAKDPEIRKSAVQANRRLT